MSGGIDLTRIIHEGSGGGEGFLLNDTAVQTGQDLRKAPLISLCLRDRLRSFRNEVPMAAFGASLAEAMTKNFRDMTKVAAGEDALPSPAIKTTRH